MTSITVELDPDLCALLERRAASRGVTVEEYVHEAVRTCAADPSGGEDAADCALPGTARPSHPVAAESMSSSNGHSANGGVESNLAYVGRLWETFRTGGAAKLAELVPAGVEWRPLAGSGCVIRDIDELDDFWASRDVKPATASMFYEDGGDVLVRAELAVPDGGVTEIWSVYRFDGHTLIEAASFGSEGEARDYAAERRAR